VERVMKQKKLTDDAINGQIWQKVTENQ
jgi:hypothetical protein